MGFEDVEVKRVLDVAVGVPRREPDVDNHRVERIVGSSSPNACRRSSRIARRPATKKPPNVGVSLAAICTRVIRASAGATTAKTIPRTSKGAQPKIGPVRVIAIPLQMA